MEGRPSDNCVGGETAELNTDESGTFRMQRMQLRSEPIGPQGCFGFAKSQRNRPVGSSYLGIVDKLTVVIICKCHLLNLYIELKYNIYRLYWSVH